MQLDFSNFPNLVHPVFHPIFQTDKTYIIMVGGRGSGKSFVAAEKIIYNAFSKPCKQLVCHKYQTHIKSTCFAQIIEVLNLMQLQPFYEATVSPCHIQFTFKFPGTDEKSEIIFKGLDHFEKQKSMPGIDTIWVEELSMCTLLDLQSLRAILREPGNNNQLIATTNPEISVQWVEQWAKERPDDALYSHTTYLDNPDLDQSWVHEYFESLKQNPSLYKKWALGLFAQLEGSIYPNFKIEPFPTDMTNYHSFIGMDVGVNDPSVISRVFYKDPNIYIRELYYATKDTLDIEKTNEHLVKVLKDLKPGNTDIYIDNSDLPLIISAKQAGLNAKACLKGPGSVFAGISWLKSRNLILHPESRLLIQDFENYCWKEVNGKFVDEPCHKFSHGCDSVRYAVSALINDKRMPFTMDRNKLPW